MASENISSICGDAAANSSELKKKLEGIIASGLHCRILATNTNKSNTREHHFASTGLNFHSDRDPPHWASFAEHRFDLFPGLAEYARKELSRALDYQEKHAPYILIEVVLETEYQQRFKKERSVYASRHY